MQRCNDWVFLLTALAVVGSACGRDSSDADAGTSDGGSGGGDSGGSDAGGGDSGAVDDHTPITARPSRGTSQCTLSRPRTDHSPRNWGPFPALVTTSGGTALFVRREFMSANPVMTSPGQLLVGGLAIDGTFATPTAVTPVMPADVGPIAAAPRSTGIAAVWVEGTKLRFGAFDAQGASLVAPRDIATGLGDLGLGDPAIAAGPDGGFGVIYARVPELNAREVQFLVLDANGAVKSGPRRLDATGTAPASAAPAPAIAAGTGGYAMIWRDPSDPRGGIDFAKADFNGNETIARHRISVTNDPDVIVGGTTGFDSATNALIDTPNGFVAAWSEARHTMSFDNGAWSTVQLARLDGAGVRQGAPVPMRAPVDSIDEVEPSLAHFGNALAVTWARGRHIYLCAGCTPDHRIDLLLLDPADLSPLSNVVSVANDPGAIGGLLDHQVAVLGSAILTTFQLTFHVHATAGSATFNCAP
jgi:hypothetical protein